MELLTRDLKFELSLVMEKRKPLNKTKDQHKMALRSLRKLVKPLLLLIKKKNQLKKQKLNESQQENAYNSSLEDMRKDPVALNATHDNLANEALEQRIFDEIRHCSNKAAFIIQEGDGHRVVPVHPQQQYIPVHFARTSNGTFFWTSTDMTRQQELQLRAQLDRWGQA